MDSGYSLIAEQAVRLARQVPASVVHAVADRIGQCPGPKWDQVRAQIALAVPTPESRGQAIAFFDEWREKASSVPAAAVAAALLTAGRAQEGRKGGTQVHVAWTGPRTGAYPFRQTEQAILEILDSAAERITLVSYAVYRVPQVRKALIRAARRGVRIRVVLESPEKEQSENEYSTLQALGEDVAAVSTVYYWPKEKRPKDAKGKAGILHVKCVVADGRWLFLSSANLTRYAFTINMELGVLVKGGRMPGRVQEHFDRLVAKGTLVPLV